MGTSLTRCQFTRGAKSITVDAPAERRWVAPITGEAGEATIRLPRNSPAASTDYIAPDGGSLVWILSEGDCGIWGGIIVDVDDSDPNTLLLTAYQPAKLLGRRYVDRSEYMMDVSAGLAASVLLRESLTGVRGLTMGATTFEGGVIDGDFRLRGDAWSGLTTLMDNSDGELHISATGEIHWCGSLAFADRYDTLLIAGSNLRDVSYTTSIQERASEVYSGEGRDAWVSRAAGAALDGWPAQVTVSGGPQAAQRELEARSRAAITISGGVTSDHWDIRERDFVNVMVPEAGFGGRTHRCRVLARSLADGDELMQLELQVIQPRAAVSLSGAGGRQRPAQRASEEGLSGSFAQVFGMLTRMAGEMAYKAKFEARYGVTYDEFARMQERRGTWPSNIPRF